MEPVTARTTFRARSPPGVIVRQPQYRYRRTKIRTGNGNVQQDEGMYKQRTTGKI